MYLSLERIASLYLPLLKDAMFQFWVELMQGFEREVEQYPIGFMLDTKCLVIIQISVGIRKDSDLQGWTDAMGGPGRWGCASMVTVFLAWSWLKSSYICSTVRGLRFWNNQHMLDNFSWPHFYLVYDKDCSVDPPHRTQRATGAGSGSTCRRWCSDHKSVFVEFHSPFYHSLSLVVPV